MQNFHMNVGISIVVSCWGSSSNKKCGDAWSVASESSSFGVWTVLQAEKYYNKPFWNFSDL